MANLVDLLAEANGALVDRAVDVTVQIAEAEKCSDVRGLVGEAEQLPEDPARRARVAGVESALDSVRTARSPAAGTRPGREPSS